MTNKKAQDQSGQPDPTSGRPAQEQAAKLECGIVMPISSLDNCSADHWAEVKTIVCDAVEGIGEPRFTAKLVSDADEIGVIQKRIVQNLYTADIVVCDVSGKNPNVMFELGMRLAFDKATVIIKDDKTDYSFDTGVVEHLGYPRDLRFTRMVDFKKALAAKVVATHSAAQKGHSTFLKSFGQFNVAKVTETPIPADQLMLSRLDEISTELIRLRRHVDSSSPGLRGPRSVVGIARVSRVVAEYRAQHPEKPLIELLDDRGFIERMEELSDAPRHFKSSREFRDVLVALIAADSEGAT